MLINLTFLLLSNSWPPFPLLPLQILHTLPSPHTPSNTCENKIGGPLWQFADLSNKNMASMYETRFWSGRSWHPSTMKIHWRGNSTRSWLKMWAFSEERSVSVGLLQRNETNFPFLTLGHYYKPKLHISIGFVCLLLRITDLLLDHKNRGWSFHLKKEKAAYKGKAYVVEWGGAKKDFT